MVDGGPVRRLFFPGPVGINENQKESMEINENHSKSKEIYGNQ